MAKIDHLDMGAQLKASGKIEVKKGFLGIGSKIIYKPTGSVVRIKENEYSAEDGKRLETILAADPDNIGEAIGQNPVAAAGIGKTKLQACLSADRQFAAVQLLVFKDFDFSPLTGVKMYEGSAAEAIAQLF